MLGEFLVDARPLVALLVASVLVCLCEPVAGSYPSEGCDERTFS